MHRFPTVAASARFGTTAVVSLAVNDYRQGGGGGFTMISAAPLVYDSAASIRDLLVAEIQRLGTISPEQFHQRNWEVVPAALAEQAVAEQNRRGAPR